MHGATHPLALQCVRLVGADVPRTPCRVEDWVDRVRDRLGDQTAIASPAALSALWDEQRDGDAPVVAGYVGHQLVLVHVQELGQVAIWDPWAGIETD